MNKPSDANVETELTEIPGIGKALSKDLIDTGIKRISDLRNKNPLKLYEKLNRLRNKTQDRCVLYAFRCAVYYAETDVNKRDLELLKWWNWKNRVINE